MRIKVTRTIIAGALLACVLLFAAFTSVHSYAATRSAPLLVHHDTVNRPCPPTIQEGSQGAPVTTLQVELNWVFGYQNVPIDSIFGPETDAAVRDFQSHVGLPANGIVDATTWHALGEC